MPLFDLDQAMLQTYLPDIDEPADFDAFWAKTLAETHTHDLALTLKRVESGLCLVDVFDAEFAGFGGHPIRAWRTRPATGSCHAGLLPAVVEYNGYGGGRGLPHQHLAWAAAGHVHLFMDTPSARAAAGDPAATPPTRSAPVPPRRAS